jgi:ABC-type transporter Mla MlaB component
VALTGKLTADGAGPLEPLARLIDKGVTEGRVDLSQLTGFDDSGARGLAELLARARKARMALELQRPDKLRAQLDEAVRKGRDGGQPAWLLSLELMQWQHEQTAFDDRALEFAVAFEVSPPSWEPPPEREARAALPGAEPALETTAPADPHVLPWTGVMAGSGLRQLAELGDHALSRHTVAVDMSGLDRIDFVCAGALLNTINRIEGQRKSVQIAGASPIIRALLLLIGISPRHFVRKTA